MRNVCMCVWGGYDIVVNSGHPAWPSRKHTSKGGWRGALERAHAHRQYAGKCLDLKPYTL